LIGRKNQNGEAYIIPWWIEGNVPLITSRIRLQNEEDGDHMLNDAGKEVWCSGDENGIWL